MRLTEIRTYASGSNPIKSYRISHGYDQHFNSSTVSEITECSSSGCFRPIQFSYQSSGLSFKAVPSSKPSSGHGGDYTKGYGDFNGDGITDISLVHWSQTYGWSAKIALGKGDGTFAASKTSKPSAGHGGDYTKDYGDFNGDGITDISLVHWSQTYGWSVKVALGKGDGTFSASKTSKPSAGHGGAYSPGTGDFNGDGITDISLVHWSQTYGWSVKIALGKGDGTFEASKTSKPSAGHGGDYTKGYGDFNGDGITDISLVQWSQTYGWSAKIALGKGDGTFEASKTSKPSAGHGGAYTKGYGDFNGDGVTDISLVHWSQTYGWSAKIALGKGDGTFAASKTSKPSGGHGGAYSPGTGDFNGDGITDISLVQWSQDYGWTSKVALGQAEPIKLDSYSYSENNTATIVYGLMTDSALYTKSKGSTYPIRDLQYPKTLVSEVTQSDGSHGERTTKYKYSGLRFDAKARRTLGFQSTISEDSRTDIRTVTRFNQTYPYVGMKISVLNEMTSGLPLSHATYSGFNKVETVNGYSVWFPYSTTQTDISYLRDSNLALAGRKSVKTVTAYNSSGQITKSVVQSWGDDSLGQFTVTTNNIYQNSYSYRRQGEIVRASVTSSSPGTLDITRESSFSYDWSTGKLLEEVIEPNSSDSSIRRVTNYGYDDYGNQISAVTCDGSLSSSCTTAISGARFSSIQFDSNGLFAVKTSNALGQTISSTYDERFGVVTSVTDINGHTTTSAYDSFGRKVATTDPLGITATITREWCSTNCGVSVGGTPAHYKIATQTPGKPSSVSYYDEFDRIIRKQTQGYNSEKIYIDTEYDSFGRVKRESEPYFGGSVVYWNAPEYDALGRKVHVSTPNQDGSYDRSSSIEYKGFTTVVTDGLGRSSVEVKNVIGNIVKMVDKANGETVYEYDALGNLTKTTDPEGNQLILSYDLRGRKIQMNDPDMGVWNYRYNTFDQLVEQVDAKKQKTTLAYDRLGRMTSRTDLSETTIATTSKWIYDTAPGKGKGKLHQVISDGGKSYTRFTYDNLSRVTLREQVIQGRSFTSQQGYNSTGQLSSITYPATVAYPTGLEIKRDYNSIGYLTRVYKSDGSISYWSADARSPRGQLEAATFGNGVQDLNAYSYANGWLIAQQTFKGETDLRDSIYHFDTVGNITRRDDVLQAMSEHFKYDNLDRLTDSYITGGSSGSAAKSYVYSAIGNILSKSDVGDYSYYGCGGRPHAVCSAGDTAYVYDDNGNMLTATEGVTTTKVTYTPYNKPDHMQKGIHEIQFKYNADRRRHYKSTSGNGTLRSETYYVGTSGSGGKLFEQELTPSGAAKDIHYIYGAGGQAVATHVAEGVATRTEYLHRDHLGSIALTTDDAGKIVNEQVSFDAWGKRRNADWSENDSGAGLANVVGNIGFTGQESIVEIGLIHMNGRVYDPSLGRFLSADPLIQAPYNSQSFNRYSYVMNNPLGYIDPTGYSWLSKKWKKIRHKVVGYLAFGVYGLNDYTRSAVTMGVCVKLPIACGPVSAANAYASGANTKDSLKIGLRGLASSVVAANMAHAVKVSTESYYIANVLGNAVTGGVASEINGGDFKTGFIASGVSSALKPINHTLFDINDPGKDMHRVAFASLVGGASAYLSGGSVMHGMLSAGLTQHWNGNGGNRKLGFTAQMKKNFEIIREQLPMWWSSSETADLRNGLQVSVDLATVPFRSARIASDAFDVLEAGHAFNIGAKGEAAINIISIFAGRGTTHFLNNISVNNELIMNGASLGASKTTDFVLRKDCFSCID